MRKLSRLGVLAAAITLAMPTFAAELVVPEPAFTPGAVVSNDRDTACAFERVPRLYQTARSVYFDQARQVFAHYGIAYDRHRDYEFDHLVPRCLGGADVIANLWPEPLTEAVDKDAEEARICRAVCTLHTMTLEAGQRFFMTGQWRQPTR